MGDANIFISNGTCYSASGKELDKSFIPCGNDAFGHQTCCGAGDNCLGDKACFGVHGTGYGSYLTYLAGCTDPDYKDEACPDKKGIDQPWVGLTLCDNSDGVWAACSQEGNPSTLQPGSYCSCTDAAKATVAFSDANTLPNTASLPKGTGSSVQFFAGYVPTPPGTTVRETTTAPAPPPLSSKQPPPPPASSSHAPPSPPPPPPPPPPPKESSTKVEPTTSPDEIQTLTTNPTSASPSSPAEPTTGTDSNGNPTTGPGSGSGPGAGTASNTNGASPGGSTNDPSSSPDSSDPNSSNNSGGLSAGAKAGIGVGAAVAVLAFLAVIVALILHHRRKRRAASNPNDDLGNMTHTEHGVGGGGAGLGLGGGGGGGAAAAAVAAAGHKKNDSIDQPPSDISEADGQPARPWSMRSELEGSFPGTGAGGPAAASRTSEEGYAAHHEGGDDALSPIAELPGSIPAQTQPRPSTEGRRRVVVGDSVVYL